MKKQDSLIVLIEDNEPDEALMIRALRKNQINNEIQVLRDGEEAVHFFAEASNCKNIQFVLLDINLPKLDGMQVLKFIREKTVARNIPVVVLTTSTEDRDILQAYDLRANSYIRKPIDFNEFTQVVNQLSNYWFTLNIAPNP